MTTRIATVSRNTVLDFLDLLDAGAANGYVEIRTGSQPATANSAATGTLLATVDLPGTTFGAASSGVRTANSIAPALAVANGTAGWFRAYDGDNAGVIDGSVTASGGGGDLILSSVSITDGGTVTVTAWTVTAPAG